MANVLEQLNAEMAFVVEKVERGIVQVQNSSGGTGAATVWHSGGLLITNAHVVQRLPLAVSLADGRSFPAKLLAYDAALDLAALMVTTSDLPTVELGNSRSLQPGQWVMALGHPWGVRDALTAGIYIGTQTEGQRRSHLNREWLVVGLHLRPGYSGGPLVDDRGRLVGINTMMSGVDVGMAVPVHVAEAWLRRKLHSDARDRGRPSSLDPFCYGREKGN